MYTASTESSLVTLGHTNSYNLPSTRRRLHKVCLRVVTSTAFSSPFSLSFSMQFWLITTFKATFIGGMFLSIFLKQNNNFCIHKENGKLIIFYYPSSSTSRRWSSSSRWWPTSPWWWSTTSWWGSASTRWGSSSSRWRPASSWCWPSTRLSRTLMRGPYTQISYFNHTLCTE